MYKQILEDFSKGFINSIRIDYLITRIIENSRLKKLSLKFFKYNLLLYFIPYIFFKIIQSLFNYPLMLIFDILLYPINIFSTLFHIFHYIDLMRMISIYTSKTSNTTTVVDTISLTITMFIYQIVIYFINMLINIIFHDRLYVLAISLNIIILTIYHSFYCFNNLWQYKKIEIFYRIDMHEKLWPYYIGYGFLPTLIYFYVSNPFVLGIYNLYMVLVIALPFLIEPIYPKKVMPYPSINLMIFSYITRIIFSLSRFLYQKLN